MAHHASELFGVYERSTQYPRKLEKDIHLVPDPWEQQSESEPEDASKYYVTDARRSISVLTWRPWLQLTASTARTRSLPLWARVEAAFDRSRDMLDWEDNWDDEGSIAFQPSTFERARRFVVRSISGSSIFYGSEDLVPRVLPGESGSIGLHWRTSRRELLLTIPSDPGEMATFYGDDRADQSIKGTVDSSASQPWLIVWLAG